MNDSNNYKIIYIKTKNKMRKILTYNNESLKTEHKQIIEKINQNFSPSYFTKGYVKKESIYTNAKAHLYNNYFVKTDIKDFFNSINHNTLKKKVYKELNNIISSKDCETLINKCSVSDKGLPLGLVTSPTLSNIYLKDFDLRLYSELKKLHCTNLIYTRYADDMIISYSGKSEKALNNYLNNEIVSIIKKVLKEYHLRLNNNKTKFVDFNRCKQVRITGISIVEKNGQRRLSIGRNNKRKLFYDALNYKKTNNNDQIVKNKLKGKLSFYLSIEKNGFEDFLTENMRKELEEYNCKSLIEFISKL